MVLIMLDIFVYILSGLETTLLFFFITLVFSIPLGLLVATIRNTKNFIIIKIIDTYVLIMRGTPLLLQLMVCYFGLPYIGIVFDRYLACFIAFILNYTAYFTEIYRGGINSVAKGQMAACTVLGFSKSYSYRSVILPQTIKNTLPMVGNEIINLVKDTSLVYVLGIADILKNAKSLANEKGSLFPFLIVGIIYLVVIFILTKILRKIEKSYRY